MEVGDTLLGHLASQFHRHEENLASQSLAHILQRSMTSRQTLARLLKQCGVVVPDELRFRPQAWADDRTIPDLVGTADGKERVFIEAKFWAGLTDRQPVGYMKRFKDDAPGILLFVAPMKRMESLWPELLQRSRELAPTDINPAPSNVRLVRTAKGHVLALTTWDSLLRLILADLDSGGEVGAAADVRQLIGLCQRIDSEAFLPIRPEEFAPEVARRMLQLGDIVDDAVSRAVEEGFASSKSLKTTKKSGHYGRYLLLHDVGACLIFDFRKWARLRNTPLWLSLLGPNWTDAMSIRPFLADLEHATPTRLLIEDERPLIPVEVPTLVERDEVLASVVNQLREVAERLKYIRPPSGKVKAEAPPEEDADSGS